MAKTGIVYLVGAGPGEPGLVTLRAKELIERADVVVYDYLLHPDLLKWCREDCLRIYVGKKASLHSVPQEEIEQLLVKHAKAGKQVVRLKGGDPLVFGRGGEEARRLAEDGIAFEIVPGVTAAVAAAAYAGIPLTHRNTSSSVVFLTGHEDPTKHELQIDWRGYGALPGATLAVYMGMGHLRFILQELMAGGMRGHTPAAVVQWASLHKQRCVEGTVATLADLTAQAKLSSPAVILIGDVVKNRQKIDWFEKLPLFGKRVAITRTRNQASELRETLEARGAEVLELPLIKISKAISAEVWKEVMDEIASYDWIVFTSANGARYFFEEFFNTFDDVRSLGFLRFACVGEGTAEVIRRYRLKIECMPETSTAELLATALIATGSLDNAKVLVITGNQNKDTLVTHLEEARAIVDRLQVYRTEQTNLTVDPAAEAFRRDGAHAILFASSSAAESFAKQAGSLKLAPNAPRPLTGSIGPQTSETMKKLGMPVDFEAKEPGIEALVEALVERLKKQT